MTEVEEALLKPGSCLPSSTSLIGLRTRLQEWFQVEQCKRPYSPQHQPNGVVVVQNIYRGVEPKNHGASCVVSGFVGHDSCKPNQDDT